MVDHFPTDTHNVFASTDVRLATWREVLECVGDTLNPQLDPGGGWFRDAVEQQAARDRQDSETEEYGEEGTRIL
jgi:hypothetical protein